MFEPRLQSSLKETRIQVRKHLRHASRVAGVQGRQTVLYIREELVDSCLEDIDAFMKQGKLIEILFHFQRYTFNKFWTSIC